MKEWYKLHREYDTIWNDTSCEETEEEQMRTLRHRTRDRKRLRLGLRTLKNGPINKKKTMIQYISEHKECVVSGSSNQVKFYTFIFF